jgi:hypothetical protein
MEASKVLVYTHVAIWVTARFKTTITPCELSTREHVIRRTLVSKDPKYPPTSSEPRKHTTTLLYDQFLAVYYRGDNPQSDPSRRATLAS